MTEVEWLVGDKPARMLAMLIGKGEAMQCEGRDPKVGISDRKLKLIKSAVVGFTKIADIERLMPNPPSWDFWYARMLLLEPARCCAVIRDIAGSPFDPVSLPRDAPAKKLHPCPNCKRHGRYCDHCYGTKKVEAACGECLDTGTVYTGMDGMKWIPCVRCPKPGPCRWLTWNNGAVRKMAEKIYEEDAFDRLPIMADALEDSGCTDVRILNHCRDLDICPGQAGHGAVGDPLHSCVLCGGRGWVPRLGPHKRGCWIVDVMQELE